MDVVQKHDRATLTEETSKPKRSSNIKTTKEKDAAKQTMTDQEKERDAIEKLLSPKKKPKDEKKLRKKLLEVAEKNETLAKAISNKNNEIADLKRSVFSLNEVLNSVPIDELRCNSSIASSKILELSKKNRQLRAELETTKNRVSKKEMLIEKLERNMKMLQDKNSQEADTQHKVHFMPIDELQAKTSALQQKLFESRNKNIELQNQLKLAQKCLQQEVGESFNLNILASQPQLSQWRGRAQQILHLQQKVHELRDRLEAYDQHSNGRVSSYYPAEANIATTKAPAIDTVGASSNFDVAASTSSFDRFAPGVRKTEILHRAKVDTLEKEIAAMKMQLEEQRGKILALKVRNKTLNDEMLRYKSKSCSLEEQTDYNGLNLASINEKLNMQKFQFEQRSEEMSRELSKADQKRTEAEYRADDLRNKVDNLEDALNNKECYIKELNGIIEKLETDLKAVCGGYLFACRELRKEEFIAILDALETEKNQLVEYNKSLNERLQQERNKNENVQEQLSKQKIRISRSDAKIRDLEKELEIQTERKKRSQRIAEYANSVSVTSLNSGGVGSFVFENSSLSSVGGRYTPHQHDEMSQSQIADLKHQLEFAREKITLLEEKNAHLVEEKENDSKTFEDIIVNSKHIILDTIMSQHALSQHALSQHALSQHALSQHALNTACSQDEDYSELA